MTIEQNPFEHKKVTPVNSGVSGNNVPATENGNKLTAIDQGFYIGQTVKCRDPYSPEKIVEGKITGVGFFKGEPEIAIEIPDRSLHLTVPQDEFFKLNLTEQEIKDLADASLNLLN